MPQKDSEAGRRGRKKMKKGLDGQLKTAHNR